MTRLGRHRTRIPLALVPLFVAAALVAIGRRRETRTTTRTVERLLEGANRGSTAGRDRDGFDDLPAPVRRYLETVLPETETEIETETGDVDTGPGAVRLEQSGELRLGGPDSSLTPFTATQYATVRRPGFVWDATIEPFPWASLRVRDAFVDGDGSARVTLFGALPIAGAGPGPELNEAELQRYLAEAVWYPWALLPRNGVVWEPIDDRTARATLTHAGTTASLTFHFAAGDGGGVEVERVHTERRYRRVDGGFEPTPWTGRWGGYEDRAGVRVPTVGEVVWHLDGGDLQAWRGRVTGITHPEA